MTDRMSEGVWSLKMDELPTNPRNLNKIIHMNSQIVMSCPTFGQAQADADISPVLGAGQVKSISALGSYMVAFRGQDGKALGWMVDD